MADRITYVGLDVHKESIVVAVAVGWPARRGAGVRPDREHAAGIGPSAAQAPPSPRATSFAAGPRPWRLQCAGQGPASVYALKSDMCRSLLRLRLHLLPARPKGAGGQRFTGTPLSSGGFGRRLMHQRPRGARRLSERRADRPHCGRRASRQAPRHRGIPACAGAIRRVPAGSPRRGRVGRNRCASCSGRGGRPRTSNSMMVLRARRGGTGSKYVTLRGGLRRAISVPPRSVKVWCAPILCGQTVLPACVLPSEMGDPDVNAG